MNLISKTQEVFYWNSIIAQNAPRYPQNSLSFYKQMQAKGVPPNKFTFPALLKACAALRRARETKQVHACIAQYGLDSDKFAAAALIDSYGKCDSPQDAHQLFDEIPQRAIDVVSWTSLISAFSINGCTTQAYEAFVRMRLSGNGKCRKGDVVTLGALLSAHAANYSSFLCRGRAIHSLVIKYGFESDTRLANTLIHMYSECEAIDEASKAFDGIPVGDRDVVSWNTLISGFAGNGKPELALSTFDHMLSLGYDTIAPNRVTLIAILKSCAELGCIDTSRRIHDYIASTHHLLSSSKDVAVLTALIDMHAKCGNLELAKQIFDGFEEKNVICWSAMIAGYEQMSCPDKALRLFRRMIEEGDGKVEVKPNAVTMVSVIAACSGLGASRPGKVIHRYVTSTGLDHNARVASVLIDMYAKCGDIELARKVFDHMDGTRKSVVSWSAMIGAEGLHGEGNRALQLFSEMLDQNLRPNEITFISLLSACSHAGLVEEGKSCFNCMERDHGISPTGKHYACMVDLFGRAGFLEEAHDLIVDMPIGADVAVWGCLLGACRVHGNCRLGEVAERQILNLDPQSVGHRVLLANIYGDAGRWDDVIRTRVALRKGGLRKMAGRSFIEIGNEVYGFTAEDRSHQDSGMIYMELEDLDERVRRAALIDEEVFMRSKYHSERLAIAFGMLMMKGEVEPIRISKNLRVCRDCHVYTKSVSKVIKRELIVRDSHRFHHFKDGVCSCRDYW
eukprot:TRINITY_DN8122_c0_g2_i1.p1 TRINITY_DN8122_c0_g2~~TRINITY_DN8122_c0_g2_i1.p1  ORF type:complete len:734 (+),score=99.70 TRINITY_DN8122_c0_g2_i1:308-2509(+)